MVDAANLKTALEESPMTQTQIGRGDVLVLNKLDLVTGDLRETEQLIRSLNGHAPIIHATHGVVPWSLLLDTNQGEIRDLADLDEEETQTGFTTFSFTTQAVFSDLALDDFLDDIAGQVFRIKGLVRTDERPGWTLVNQVSGRTDLRAYTPNQQRSESALVFIGARLDEAEIRAQLSATLNSTEP